MYMTPEQAAFGLELLKKFDDLYERTPIPERNKQI